MRSASLTFAWPMNSASRCGRSDSSTTVSSAIASGVVISARVMDNRLDARPDRRQSLARFLERGELLAEGEAHDRLAAAVVIERRARHRCDADLRRKPARELRVVQ